MGRLGNRGQLAELITNRLERVMEKYEYLERLGEILEILTEDTSCPTTQKAIDFVFENEKERIEICFNETDSIHIESFMENIGHALGSWAYENSAHIQQVGLNLIPEYSRV